MQLNIVFSVLVLRCGAVAQFDNDIKGILSFYCQIDSVDHENLSGICAAADGTQEPLDGCCLDTAVVPDAAAVFAQGCADNGGEVAEGEQEKHKRKRHDPQKYETRALK